MNSLYNRLFRYRSRQDHQPLEDFLTEALADLAGRMPREDLVELIGWCFRDTARPPNLARLNGAKVSFITQVAVPGGVADLVMYVDGRPMLVVENKTWSGFRDHGSPERPANQMTTYCKWLMEASGDAECAALLITGTNDAPPGFHDGGGYAVAARGQVTWASLGRWLSSRLPAVEERRTWHDLAAELIVFIREKDLDSETFTTSDLAALTLVMPAMDRWDATLRSMWSAADDIRKRFLDSRHYSCKFQPEAGLYWNWKYEPRRSSGKKAYVGLGIRLPEMSSWYPGLQLPSSPHMIVIVSTDDGRLIHSGPPPEGWLIDDEDGDRVRALPTSELPLDPGRRIERLNSWMRETLAGAETILAGVKIK